VPEHCGAILIGVLVKHDAGGRTGQQPRELGLALDKGQRPLILAVELKGTSNNDVFFVGLIAGAARR
jgi:hypothetical protein